METLSIQEIFKNSFRYTLSRPLAIVILGIALSSLDYFTKPSYTNSYEAILIMIVGTLAGFYEMGYCNAILEETLKGHEKPPSLRLFKSYIQNGVKEAILYIFYIAIMIALLVIGILSENDIVLIISIAAGAFALYMINISSWNVSINHGRLRYGFNILSCFRLIGKIEHKKLIITIILTVISQSLIMYGFNFSHLSLLNIIYNFLITPFLLLFGERAIALVLKNTHDMTEKQ